MQTAESRQFFVYSLSLVRGICILGVVWMHVASLKPDFGGVQERGALTVALVFVSCVTRFAVPLFVLLSGFYLSLNPRNESPIPFYRRTLKYLVVPYVVYSVLYTFPMLRKTHDPWLFLRNLPTASASPHLWFGLLVLQLYLLHPFLSRWYRVCRQRTALVAGALALQMAWSIIVSILFVDPGGRGVGERLSLIFFVSNVGYFLAGYYLLDHSTEVARWIKRASSVRRACIAWLAVASGMTAYYAIPMFQGSPFRDVPYGFVIQSVLAVPLSVFALLTIFGLVRDCNPGQGLVYRFLHSLGLYSYGVYYLHGYCLWFFAWILRPVGDGATVYCLLAIVTPVVTLWAIRVLSRLSFGRYLT